MGQQWSGRREPSESQAGGERCWELRVGGRAGRLPNGCWAKQRDFGMCLRVRPPSSPSRPSAQRDYSSVRHDVCQRRALTYSAKHI